MVPSNATVVAQVANVGKDERPTVGKMIKVCDDVAITDKAPGELGDKHPPPHGDWGVHNPTPTHSPDDLG